MNLQSLVFSLHRCTSRPVTFCNYLTDSLSIFGIQQTPQNNTFFSHCCGRLPLCREQLLCACVASKRLLFISRRSAATHADSSRQRASSVHQIPVYRGCSGPLLARIRHAGDYHGNDGLGDVPDPDAPGLELLQKKRGVMAMIKLIDQNPGEVSLVAIAPLTNLAVAIQLDLSLPKKLKALYIMGGNTDSRGNTTVCGEFNFVADPEAAYVVLDRYTCPTYIAPWEFSCRNSLPWSFCDRWLDQNTEKAAFMKKITSLSIKVSLVATAPLTNLALAAQLNPSFTKNLKALYIMGGNMESRGNTTVCGEFNFVADPEAAYIVLDRYTCPTYISTWEFTCRNSLPWSFCDAWLAQDTEKARFMERISRHTRKVAVTVELEGTHTRGMMVLDYMDLLKKKHKVFIMKSIDLEKFKQLLMNALK